MHRELPPDFLIGESWEVSDHSHGRSVIANGHERGRTLHDLLLQWAGGRAGHPCLRAVQGCLALLVKYIDAGEELSVQVHPSDAYARCARG